ncbi:MAG: hypothetical protein ABI036_05410 [Fibrobacteria bacterium]
MKKTAFILAAFAIAYSFSAPIYFTFTGKVGFVPSDAGGYAAAHDIKPGSTVTYFFVVDTSAAPYSRLDGTTTLKSDIANAGYRADYFFDSLIAPSLFSPAVADSASGSFFGYHTTTSSGTSALNTVAFQTLIGNPDHGTQVILYIPDTSSTVFLPKVGDVVSGSEAYVGPSGASSSATLSLTLTAIGNARPNAFRPRVRAAGNWMSAELLEGSLMLRNRSGEKAVAKVLDASGRTFAFRSLEEKTVIPAASWPRGKLFLEVTPARGKPILQAFFH